jgi:hypothetical protein
VTSPPMVWPLHIRSRSLHAQMGRGLSEVRHLLRSAVWLVSQADPTVQLKLVAMSAPQGKYLEVDAPQRLVQEWRFSSWPEGTTSKVGAASSNFT